jgi:hypothetical protein
VTEDNGIDALSKPVIPIVPDAFPGNEEKHSQQDKKTEDEEKDFEEEPGHFKGVDLWPKIFFFLSQVSAAVGRNMEYKGAVSFLSRTKILFLPGAESRWCKGGYG